MDCFKSSTESLIKCAAGVRMCGAISQIIDVNSKINFCPACEDAES